MSRGLCWLRRDLRLSDHRVLARATKDCDEVIVVFVLDKKILDRQTTKKNHRVTFILESLEELDTKLRAQGSALLVLHGDPVTEIPQAAVALKIDRVFCGRDYDPSAIMRDAEVEAALAKQGIGFELIKDQVVFEKGEVVSKSGTPFRVFTPYANAWHGLLNPRQDLAEHSTDLAALVSAAEIAPLSQSLSHEAIGFIRAEPWLNAGEDAARTALKEFEKRIDMYGETRDFPAVDGVSYLSVHLRFGTLSIREAFRMALERSSAGAKKWMMELIWREFYQDILANNPYVVSTTFNPEYRDLDWPGSEEHFVAWKRGQTGFPIIDAAMRCFAETGWMHNRLRMIVASFLTKDLLVDYKKGEAYFAEQLLDYDLASNNGGWQWAASVGCDAQPYFRVFNPYLQSRKFDADGVFIRRWIPEIADLDNDEIHCPGSISAVARNYPIPIVDHAIQRKRAISMFEACRLN